MYDPNRASLLKRFANGHNMSFVYQRDHIAAHATAREFCAERACILRGIYKLIQLWRGNLQHLKQCMISGHERAERRMLACLRFKQFTRFCGNNSDFLYYWLNMIAILLK